jgi:predicted methyltransferase
MSLRVIKPAIFAAAAIAMVAGIAFAADAPAYIKNAVMDAGRPDADKERDVHRKPAELIAFAGIKSGDVVAEIMPGRGYFTRILSKAVGPKGKIYAYTLGFGDFSAITSAYPNVVEIKAPLAEFSAPEPLDVAWTTENYHDFKNPRFGTDMPAFDKKVLDALKPGGTFLVTDHAAASGHGIDDVGTLHRIDPAFVKQEVEAAGFKLEAQSDILAVPSDDHTKAVHEMHDMNDIFVLKFTKPKM